ncbi:MAG: HNH endonuclease [Candidatus Kapaibacterium sp.]
MKIYVGVTDPVWLRNLREADPAPSEVNFWKPGGGSFKAIESGCPFLFKEKAPANRIAGLGFFYGYSVIPISMAWDTFGKANGRSSFVELAEAIRKNRQGEVNAMTEIGCILLENPMFFPKDVNVDVPEDFAKNIVSGKSYDTTTQVGARLWERVQLAMHSMRMSVVTRVQGPTADYVFGKEYLRKSRPGQAGFRFALMEAYDRKCAVTGENILPVLEAAHIQPVSSEGVNTVDNGLLLRSDMHKLFDQGLITVTPDYTIRISSKIAELYVNGKVYKRWDKERMTVVPTDELSRPDRLRLQWHNDAVFIA